MQFSEHVKCLCSFRLENLDHLIYEKTGVPPEAIWAYLADGRPLRSDNIRELAGLEDQVRLIIVLSLPEPYNALDDIHIQ